MVRWRYCIVLAVLLLLTTRTGSKGDDDDADEQIEESDEEEDDDDDEVTERGDQSINRRTPPPPTTTTVAPTRSSTARTQPLECYVCIYKFAWTTSKVCLDPVKNSARFVTCRSAEEKCFTTVGSKTKKNDTIVRGCMLGCVASSNTTCCELNRCNKEVFPIPVTPVPRALTDKAPPMQTNVVFFVTILLILQTVVKVSFV